MKKRILVVYATYGNGHRIVAEYIKKSFKKKDENISVKTIDILDYSSPFIKTVSKKIFEKTMFSKIPIIWELIYKFYNNKYRSIGTKKMCYKLYDKNNLRKEVVKYKPDVVISTHYFGSMLMEKYKKEGLINSKLYTIITDYEIHEFWTKSFKSEEAIIVSNKEMKNDLLKKGISRNKIKVYGIPLSDNFMQDLDIDDLKRKLKLDNDRKTILFFGGGNNSKSSLAFLKKALNYDANFNILFIAGKNKELKNKVTKLAKENNCKNIKILGYVNNVYEYMYASDLVVTKPGGLTVTECLYLHKPMLIINRNAGQEKGNYKYLVKNKFAIKTSHPYKFAKYLKEIANNDKILKNMQKALKKYGQKHALDDLFNLIMK